MNSGSVGAQDPTDQGPGRDRPKAVMPPRSSVGMRALTLVVLPFVAIWLALRGLARWTVHLPARLVAMLGRVATAITTMLGRVATAITTMVRPVVVIVHAVSARLVVLLRAAGRAAIEVIGAIGGYLRAIGSRIAQLLRATIWMVLSPFRLALRLLGGALRDIAMVVARVWSRVATMARGLTSTIAAVVRATGIAIRGMSARITSVVREVARLAVATVRPVGHLLRHLAVRIAVAVRGSFRVIGRTARYVGGLAWGWAHGLATRAGVLARALVLVTRVGWSAMGDLSRAVGRRLQAALLLATRAIGIATDAMLLLLQAMTSSLVRWRVILGRVAHVVGDATRAAMRVVHRILNEALRLVLVPIGIVMVPIVGAGHVLSRIGRSVGRSLQQAAIRVRGSLRALASAVRHAMAAAWTAARRSVTPLRSAWIAIRSSARRSARASRAALHSASTTIRSAARQAARASRAAFHSASTAIRSAAHDARSLGHRHR